jgi:hypothetical protein
MSKQAAKKNKKGPPKCALGDAVKPRDVDVANARGGRTVVAEKYAPADYLGGYVKRGVSATDNGGTGDVPNHVNGDNGGVPNHVNGDNGGVPNHVNGKNGGVPNHVNGKNGGVPNHVNGENGGVPNHVNGENGGVPNHVNGENGGVPNHVNGENGGVPNHVNGENGGVPNHVNGENGGVPNHVDNTAYDLTVMVATIDIVDELRIIRFQVLRDPTILNSAAERVVRLHTRMIERLKGKHSKQHRRFFTDIVEFSMDLTRTIINLLTGMTARDEQRVVDEYIEHIAGRIVSTGIGSAHIYGPEFANSAVKERSWLRKCVVMHGDLSAIRDTVPPIAHTGRLLEDTMFEIEKAICAEVDAVTRTRRDQPWNAASYAGDPLAMRDIRYMSDTEYFGLISVVSRPSIGSARAEMCAYAYRVTCDATDLLNRDPKQPTPQSEKIYTIYGDVMLAIRMLSTWPGAEDGAAAGHGDSKWQDEVAAEGEDVDSAWARPPYVRDMLEVVTDISETARFIVLMCDLNDCMLSLRAKYKIAMGQITRDVLLRAILRFRYTGIWDALSDVIEEAGENTEDEDSVASILGYIEATKLAVLVRLREGPSEVSRIAPGTSETMLVYDDTD